MGNRLIGLAAATLIAATLFAPLRADELWVKNQPFPGVTAGSGPDMLVELRTIVHMLGLSVEDQGEQVIVGGFPIPVETQGQVRLVSLRDLVDAAGLFISRNPDLGTVDVRQASAGTGSRGNWVETNELSSSEASPNSTKGPVTQLAGRGFSVNVPGHLRVMSEPGYLKSEPSPNVTTSSLNEAYSPIRTAFMVTTQRGPDHGMLSFNLVPELPQDLSPKDEPAFFEELRSSMTTGSARALGPSQISTIAGKQFHEFKVRDKEEDGILYDNELSFHVDRANNQVIMILLKAPQKYFNQVAPQLRLVTKNLRIK